MNVSGFLLDNQQLEIVKSNIPYLLVVAGAGSGKTLTILGKIKYLIQNGINESEILCISFTKAAALSLKEKINNELKLDIDVYTFHKLALNILENKYEIASDDTLDFIIDEFFDYDIKKHKIYKKIKRLSDSELSNLKVLIKTFIRIYKCNNYSLDYFNIVLKKVNRFYNFYKRKEKNLLIIILNIYIKYQKYLKDNNLIDFDDMLIYAAFKVKKAYDKKIKYIIIDEYQDTSYIRFKLIKEIIDKTNAKLLAVGDDFQSIYRFTGCDINLFLNFNKYFNNSSILKIENTYRNSYELIKIAGSFVMKNKLQIKKNLKSNKHLINPIEIVYYKNRFDFKKLLERIDTGDLLVLGRNNKDIFDYIDKSFRCINNKYYYKNIAFTYMTVHKSKGLEANNVIILNMKNSDLGFPTKIKEERILKYIKEFDKYPFEEERRLFYVALTRTKNKVYLFTPINNESIFVAELKKDYNVKSIIL